MAGKRNRKRKTDSKKKASKEKTNEEIAVCKQKKPKLDDELGEQQTKEPEKLAQQPSEQPNVETCKMQVAETNDDASSDSKTAEENKYVPPFTRKPKRTLQRDRSLVSPDVTTTRPKRRWKERKQNSQEDQQSPGDVTNMKDSPKMEKEEKEDEVDVVGLEGVKTCSQENNDCVMFSASQTSADKSALTTDDVPSSSPVVNVQEETSTIVKQIIDDVLDTMCKSINQCNSQEINKSELNKEECKQSVDGKDTQMDANINIEVQDGVVTEAVQESRLETDINTVTVPTKAALKKTVIEKTATKSLKTGSELQTTVQDQATTTQSVEGHVSSGQEVFTLEGGVEESHDRQVRDPAGEMLQNDNELPCSIYQNENEDGLKQQRETDKAKELCDQDNTVESKGDWVNEEETEPNLGLECSTVLTPEVKDAFSSGNIITSMSPAKVCSVSHDSEHECQQQKAGDNLLEAYNLSADHTGMDHKQNMDTPILQKVVPGLDDSDIWRDSENNKQQHECDKDLDQMVPTNFQTTTAMLQENPDVEALLRKPKRKESDLEDSAYGCSKALVYSPKVREKEHENDELRETVDHVLVVETKSTKEFNGSCQESSPPLNAAQASDVYMNEKPVIHCEIATDKTETCTKSTFQNEPLGKQLMPGNTELHEPVEGKSTENQSSKLEAGCSIFGFDDDIMEYDCLMDCSDSQLVHVDESLDEKALLASQKHDARQVHNCSIAGNCISDGNQCSMEVPSDRGMIKGLISELSGLNKFIMGAWKDLENQKKRRQARLKLSKAKKLK